MARTDIVVHGRHGRARGRCPYCMTCVQPLDATWKCPRCATEHHAECARENGRCTVHGCHAGLDERAPVVAVTETVPLAPVAPVTPAADPGVETRDPVPWVWAVAVSAVVTAILHGRVGMNDQCGATTAWFLMVLLLAKGYRTLRRLIRESDVG